MDETVCSGYWSTNDNKNPTNFILTLQIATHAGFDYSIHTIQQTDISFPLPLSR